MNRLLLACVVLCLTSQLLSAVILRPKWYPYFRRENQGGSGNSGSTSGNSNRPSGALLSSRQARNGGGIYRSYPSSRNLYSDSSSYISSINSDDNDNNVDDVYNRGDSRISSRAYTSRPSCAGMTSGQCLQRILRAVDRALEKRRASLTGGY